MEKFGGESNIGEEPEVVGEKEISQEKEYSQEELAKIGEKVIAEISKIKGDIEKLENGECERWNESVKHVPPSWSEEKIKGIEQEEIKELEKKLKKLEFFID